MTVMSVVVNIMKLRNEVVGVRKVVRNLFLCLFDIIVGAMYEVLAASRQVSISQISERKLVT
jgi:hypothetical protein